jgi:hypothetical protein
MSDFRDFAERYEAILAEGVEARFLRWDEDGAAELIDPDAAARQIEERAQALEALRERERQGIADAWNDYSLATKTQGGNKK